MLHNHVARVGMRARAATRMLAAGYTLATIHHAFELAGPQVYDAAFLAAGVNPDAPPPVAGPIIDAVLAWLKSDQGQAVIAMLVKLLIAALVAV